MHPGESLTLIVGGADTWKVASLDDVSILGTGISIDPSRPLGMIKTASGTNVGIGFNVNVAPDAKPGPRTVRLRLGDQVAASTGGIVVGMRTIPQRSLYLPYLFSSSEQYTGIALANPAGTPAVVRISARDNKGDLIYDTNALVPADLSIAGGAQIARLEREIFNLPTGSQQSGSIIVESDSQSLQGFFLTGDGSTFLDGAEAFKYRFIRDIAKIDSALNRVDQTRRIINRQGLDAELFPGFADDVTRAPGYLAPAYRRNDAVGAF